MRRFVKSSEIAARYRVSVETVRAWARRGWIPSIRIGLRPILFDPKEVDRALQKRGDRRRPTEKPKGCPDGSCCRSVCDQGATQTGR